jgi:RHS repeat-associated protein
VVAESDAGGELAAYNVRGDDLLAVLRPGTGPRFFHADGLGSIRALTDETGAVTDRYTFTAFGELLDHQGADENAYLFAGEPLDPNSGFYYLRARWMDPGAGRFVGMDSFEGFKHDPLTLHSYIYGHVDPANHLDPSGEVAVSLSNLAIAMDALALAALTTLAIVTIGVLVIEKAKDVPVRLNHYTRWDVLPKIMRPGPQGGINNPNGDNYFTPDFYFSGQKAKSRLATRLKPQLFISLLVRRRSDKLAPFRRVEPANNERGGGIETFTSRPVPFWARLPVVVPIAP